MEQVGKNNELMILSILSSLLLAVIFASLSLFVNSKRMIPIYTHVDIIAGTLFVFTLAMIVSISVWPMLMRKKA